MGTTAEKLQAILDSKADIKDAIEAKGVTVGDATLAEYASKIGEISTGRTEAEENDVNFYDYDGFRVASYTIAEAKALTALPTPPTHEGLTFQEWNWTLNDITTYNRRYIDVGANYVTSDDKTYFKIRVNNDLNVKMDFNWRGVLTIDWGDGTTPESMSKTVLSSNVFEHSYVSSGIYSVKLSFSGDIGDKYGPVFKLDNNTYWTNDVDIIEVNCGSNFSLGYNSSLLYCRYPLIVSVAKDTSLFYSSFVVSLTRGNVKMFVVPKTAGAFVGCNFDMGYILKVSFPKQVDSFLKNGFYGSRIPYKIVLPEFTTGTPSSNALTQAYTTKIFSIPLSWNTSIGVSVVEYDIVQGWVPSVNLTMNNSGMSVKNILDIFNKLGTTTNAITLTFGSTNLDKLTAEEKAIATNKGYTLA